jgi:hypothetical protein
MARFACELVQGNGVTPFEDLPVNPLYFTEIAVPEKVCIPAVKPDIEELVSVTVDAKVISVRLIKTAIGTSNEGQELSGYKIIVELKLRQKVKYIADEPTQSVHAAHFEKVLSSVFVVVPPTITIGGVPFPIELLFAENRLIVTPYIEDIYAARLNKRCIFKNITLLVDVTAI